MKILAFVDVHASFEAFKKIKEKAKKQKPDVIVCAGDISVFEQGLEHLLREFNKYKVPFLIVQGNHETQATLTSLSSKLKNVVFLHKKSYILGNYLFLGYGGGGFSKIEPGLKKISGKFRGIIKRNADKKVILVTHAPPYKTKLDSIEGHACGNKTLKDFLKKNRVDLVVCGHLHENAGKSDKIKKTRIVNPGPYGRIISI
jgi:hypothetical protein